MPCGLTAASPAASPAAVVTLVVALGSPSSAKMSSAVSVPVALGTTAELFAVAPTPIPGVVVPTANKSVLNGVITVFTAGAGAVAVTLGIFAYFAGTLTPEEAEACPCIGPITAVVLAAGFTVSDPAGATGCGNKALLLWATAWFAVAA